MTEFSGITTPIAEADHPSPEPDTSAPSQPSASRAVTIVAALFALLAILKAFFAVTTFATQHDIAESALRSSHAPAGTIGGSLHELQTKVVSNHRMNAAVASVESLVFFLTGLLLLARTQRWFCLFGSGLACLTIPLSTALGIATIIILRANRT